MTKKKIRVMLVEDHRIVREGLRALLGGNDCIELVGEAGDGRDAVRKAAALNPDVVVMDILLPELNGIDATRQIAKNHPGTGVVLLSMCADRDYIDSAISAGAGGYILKGEGISELVKAIEAVARGEAFFSPPVAKIILEEIRPRAPCREDLTAREREVLQLIAEGKTSSEAAGILGISVKTAEGHRTNIMSKLDIHNVAGLIRYAIKKGLVSGR
jgi:two-component system response regulator NreC